MKKIIILGICLLINCCSHQKKYWNYTPNEYEISSSNNLNKQKKDNFQLNKFFKDKIISIVPFIDKRENINNDYAGFYAIILCPFGWQNFGTPERISQHINSGPWLLNPKKDFAKALMKEIENSKLFKDVYISRFSNKSDYYIRSEIISTQYKSKIFSYGLGLYGFILWYIGLPATFTSNSLIIKIEILDSNSNDILFSKEYVLPNYTNVSWIYKLKEDFHYEEMLKKIYKEFIEDLLNLKI